MDGYHRYWNSLVLVGNVVGYLLRGFIFATSEAFKGGREIIPGPRDCRAGSLFMDAILCHEIRPILLSMRSTSMKIKSSGEEYGLGEGWRSREYKLPDKSWVTLDVEGDPKTTEWSYFWLRFGQGGIRPAWYRVFEKGKKPRKWLAMKPAVQVLEETSVDHDS